MPDEFCCLFELAREQERLRRTTEKALRKMNLRGVCLMGCILGLVLVIRAQDEEIERLKRKEEKRQADGIFDGAR